MSDKNFVKTQEILNQVLSSLRKTDQESRRTILRLASQFFDIDFQKNKVASAGTFNPFDQIDKMTKVSPGSFSEDRSLSPKEFLIDKQPKTDVEKIACLAYYLTHYRSIPHFKTIDLSKLNTEAAQIKFSNAAGAVNNAARARFIVASTKGNKQISAIGEKFVEALPDREGAREAIRGLLPRRKPSRKIGKKLPKEG